MSHVVWNLYCNFVFVLYPYIDATMAPFTSLMCHRLTVRLSMMNWNWNGLWFMLWPYPIFIQERDSGHPQYTSVRLTVPSLDLISTKYGPLHLIIQCDLMSERQRFTFICPSIFDGVKLLLAVNHRSFWLMVINKNCKKFEFSPLNSFV